MPAQRQVYGHAQDHGRHKEEQRRAEGSDSNTGRNQSHQFPGKPCLKHETSQQPETKILKRFRQQRREGFEYKGQERIGIRKDDAVAQFKPVGWIQSDRERPRRLPVEQPAQIMSGRIAISQPRDILRVQRTRPNDHEKCQCANQQRQQVQYPALAKRLHCLACGAIQHSDQISVYKWSWRPSAPSLRTVLMSQLLYSFIVFFNNPPIHGSRRSRLFHRRASTSPHRCYQLSPAINLAWLIRMFFNAWACNCETRDFEMPMSSLISVKLKCW